MRKVRLDPLCLPCRSTTEVVVRTGNEETDQSVLVSVSVSAPDDVVALQKVHTRSAPSLNSLPKVALETVPIFVWLNTDRSRPWRVECRRFLSPLLFPSGDQCYDALDCPCSGSSSSLGAPLPCQAADQMCMSVCLY